MQQLPTTAPQILRRPAVEQLTGLSRSAIYQRIAANQFPRPVQLGARAVGWLRSDIEAFIASLAKTGGAA